MKRWLVVAALYFAITLDPARDMALRALARPPDVEAPVGSNGRHVAADAHVVVPRRARGNDATTRWRPIVNGYGRDEPPDYLSTVKTLSTFPSGEAAGLARAIGVRYFVLHSGRLPASTAVEDAQRGGLFRLLHKIGTDYLFEVTP